MSPSRRIDKTCEILLSRYSQCVHIIRTVYYPADHGERQWVSGTLAIYRASRMPEHSQRLNLPPSMISLHVNSALSSLRAVAGHIFSILHHTKKDTCTPRRCAIPAARVSQILHSPRSVQIFYPSVLPETAHGLECEPHIERRAQLAPQALGSRIAHGHTVFWLNLDTAVVVCARASARNGSADWASKAYPALFELGPRTSIA